MFSKQFIQFQNASLARRFHYAATRHSLQAGNTWYQGYPQEFSATVPSGPRSPSKIALNLGPLLPDLGPLPPQKIACELLVSNTLRDLTILSSPQAKFFKNRHLFL